MKKIDFITKTTLFILLILAIALLGNFIMGSLKVAGIAFLFFFVNYAIIMRHEKKYGGKNFPYKPYKSKKKIWERILLGLFAGVFYLFSIGTYNHKKYNTQVWYPETLECFFGNISQLIILIIYIFAAVGLSKINLYLSIAFMLIPIITNVISLKRK